MPTAPDIGYGKTITGHGWLAIPDFPLRIRLHDDRSVAGHDDSLVGQLLADRWINRARRFALDESILVERLRCSEGRDDFVVQDRLQSHSVVSGFGINPFALELLRKRRAALRTVRAAVGHCMDARDAAPHHSQVRVLAHIKKLDDCFGQFLVRVICDYGFVREIEPEALGMSTFTLARGPLLSPD
jgi:hypothetical protein